MSLPALALRRPTFIAVVCLVVTLLGVISFMRLPIDLMPDVSFPAITVTTNYQGVGPEEMEELVTIPLERALAAVAGLREMESTSSEGASRLRLTFEWGTDLDAAADEVRVAVDRTRGYLPRDADNPYVFKFDVSLFPIVFMGLSADMNARDLREFAEKQLQYRFERLPGVAQAEIWGGRQRQIHVILDREKMSALRLSPTEVVNALRRENLNEPAGQVREGSFELLMRTQGQYTSLEEIRQTMVTRREGRSVYITDFATVEDSYEEVRNLVRINGRPGIRIAVRKMSGANSVEVSEVVAEEVHRIHADFPNIELFVISDSAEYIKRSVSNVRDAALYGSFLAVFILLLFLRNARSTLVIAISIPISVIGTFGLMYFYGFTLNIITFGGLALGVGVLVDNSIVVLENIFRHRQDGQEKEAAARQGTSEVALAITASTLTTIVVFIPVVFMGGMSGVMFQQLAWVVSFALFSSLLVSLTLVPVLSSRLIRVREPDPSRWSHAVIHGMKVWLESLDRSYASGIRWALRYPKTVLLTTLLILMGGIFLLPFIGFELQPEADEGEVRVELELPEGTRLEVTDRLALQAEAIVAERFPEVQTVLTEVGNEGGWRVANTNTASLRLTLVPKELRQRSSQQIAFALRPLLSQIPGVASRVRATGGNFLMQRMSGDGDRLQVDIRGHDLSQAYEIAVQTRRLMESTEGVSDAYVSRSAGRAENRIVVDRMKAASMGLSVSDIATTIRASIGGTVATYFRERGEEYEILVRSAEEDRLRSSDVGAFPLQTPGGMVVPLETVVRFERNEGQVAITRKDQQRVVSISGSLSGSRDMGAVVEQLQSGVASLDVPADMAVVFSGEWKDQQEAFFFLKLGFALAVILVYLVMAAQFESFRYPFIIMFSLPLASIGVILSLFLTDTTFNMQAFIGIIMLVGIVVNNAIVLVDYVLRLRREEGLSVLDSLVTGGRRRLRPILMTSLTTILGLTPMALGLGEGGELQAPMARVLIGGMISSTFITLFFIPTLFLTLERVWSRTREEEQLGAGEGVVSTARPA